MSIKLHMIIYITKIVGTKYWGEKSDAVIWLNQYSKEENQWMLTCIPGGPGYPGLPFGPGSDDIIILPCSPWKKPSMEVITNNYDTWKLASAQKMIWEFNLSHKCPGRLRKFNN